MQVAVRSYLTAGVAIVGATALVAAPITTSPPDIQVPGIHAAQVELAAVTNPIEQWLQVFQGTFDNVVGIGGAVVDDPAPALRQLLANQLGYAQATAGGLTDTAEGFLGFLTDSVGPAFRQAAAQIAQGDIVGAAETITDLELPLLLAVSPLLGILSIPGQITDNLSNVVKALTNPLTVTSLLVTVLGPGNAIISAAGASGQAFVDSVNSGDPIGAITTVINIPAVLTGALLNGFTNAAGTPFPGLLTFNAAGGGLVQTLLVTLPHLIAAAITPQPPVVMAQTADIASLPEPSARTLSLVSSKDSGVDTVKHDVDPGTETGTDPSTDPGTETVTDETDATDGQVTTPTDPGTATKPDDTKDGNKAVPGEVKTGATGQGTPKSPVKQFGDQVKSFLGKLGFKPHKKTGTTESGTPAADADGSAAAGAGASRAGTNGSGTGGSTSGGGK